MRCCIRLKCFHLKIRCRLKTCNSSLIQTSCSKIYLHNLKILKLNWHNYCYQYITMKVGNTKKCKAISLFNCRQLFLDTVHHSWFSSHSHDLVVMYSSLDLAITLLKLSKFIWSYQLIQYKSLENCKGPRAITLLKEFTFIESVHHPLIATNK